MTEVKLKSGETVESALRRLKKKSLKEGTLQEVRRRAYFEKPSETRKKKKQAAKYKAKMQAEYDKWYR